MANVTLDTVASVPAGTGITVTVHEDTNNDGTAEYSTSQAIARQDGSRRAARAPAWRNEWIMEPPAGATGTRRHLGAGANVRGSGGG